MSAYCIVDVDIHDPEQYREYMRRAQPVIEAAGGRYLARGGHHKVLEGDWEPHRLVIVEFPSVAAAEAFYGSDDYREAMAIRQGCATTRIVMVEGMN